MGDQPMQIWPAPGRVGDDRVDIRTSPVRACILAGGDVALIDAMEATNFEMANERAVAATDFGKALDAFGAKIRNDWRDG